MPGKALAALRAFALTIPLAAVAAACDDGGADSPITMTSGTVMELYPVVNQSKELTFDATEAWTASCPAGWVVVSPRQGSAGHATVTVTTASTNRTRAVRSATLTLTAGSHHRTVTLVQSGKYALFDEHEHHVSADGGRLSLTFKSNTTEDDGLQMMYSRQDWIGWDDESRATTRAEWAGHTQELTIARNTTANRRTAAYVLAMPTADGEWMGLDTAYVVQAGMSSGYESADYSADGQVTQLQQATAGTAIPIVLMGDGFADRDVSDGRYARLMATTMEHLFSEEPVKSLRDYFDVYAVTAVSQHDAVGDGHLTALGTEPSSTTTDISYDEDRVAGYARLVPGLDYERSLVVVIVNSSSHNGVTTLLLNEQTGQPRQHAVCLCTLMGGSDDEAFRQVLVHEVIGHGLAKLADEYGYNANGAVTDAVVRQLQYYHRHQWMLNVDATDDTAGVTWSPFIGDSRFSQEQIGVYEGGFTYAMGIYRPTEESMMRSNQSPFNAPSRKAIYDRVMALAEGRSATTVDEFARFDEAHKPQRWSYAATRGFLPLLHPHPAAPVIVRSNK